MLVKHLKTSDYRVMPWKNGGGSTTELAIEPPGAALGAPFVWRVSLAHLPGSGPFSPFPGYERHIVQLAGEPMRLDHGADGCQQLTPLVPYRFRGEWGTTGLLSSGEARDFNVMTRQGDTAAHVECLALAGRGEVRRAVPGLMLVYAHAGSITVEAGSERLELAEAETARLEGRGTAALSGIGTAIVVAIA